MSELKQYLSVESCRCGAWLDDETIAFISTRSGAPQVWQKNLTTGEMTRRSFSNERLWALKTTPAQKAVLFCMDQGGNENEQIFCLRPQDSQPVDLTQDPQTRHYLGGMTADGCTLVYTSNARCRASFDVMALDLATGEKRMVLENHDNYNLPAELSPNGQYLLYNKLKGESDNAMWMVDVQNGRVVKIPDDAVTAKYTGPAWKHDSTGFFVLTDRESEFSWVGYYDVAAATLTKVYETNWDVETLALSADDRYLAMIVNADGYSELRILDLTTGRMVNAPQPPKGVYCWYEPMNWSPSGHRLLFSLVSGKRPQDLWVLDLDADSVQKVTDSSLCGISPDELVEPQLCHYTSFDGLTVPYWLYVPNGKEPQNLPVLVEIHGGPEGQETPVYTALIQYLLGQGIAVVAPNVRGSTGYGKTYTHLDDVEKRLDSVRDIDSLVAHLVETGVADKDRMAVSGMSYGGFMTLSCAVRYPHLWCCAVDTVGMFNLESFLENTAEYRRAHRESEYGTLAHDRETLRRVSPIAKVDDITGPLMVIHGANDPRVPVSEAEQVVGHLKAKGVPVTYIRYEDEGHGIIKLENQLDCYPKVAAFLRENMKL